MATKKTPSKSIEELKVRDGDFVDYTGFDFCKEKQKRRKRKTNFNVIWFSMGTVFGMCMSAGMIIWGFILH